MTQKDRFDELVREACAKHADPKKARAYVRERFTQKMREELFDHMLDLAIRTRVYEQRHISLTILKSEPQGDQRLDDTQPPFVSPAPLQPSVANPGPAISKSEPRGDHNRLDTHYGNVSPARLRSRMPNPSCVTAESIARIAPMRMRSLLNSWTVGNRKLGDVKIRELRVHQSKYAEMAKGFEKVERFYGLICRTGTDDTRVRDAVSDEMVWELWKVASGGQDKCDIQGAIAASAPLLIGSET